MAEDFPTWSKFVIALIIISILIGSSLLILYGVKLSHKNNEEIKAYKQANLKTIWKGTSCPPEFELIQNTESEPDVNGMVSQLCQFKDYNEPKKEWKYGIMIISGTIICGFSIGALTALTYIYRLWAPIISNSSKSIESSYVNQVIPLPPPNTPPPNIIQKNN